MPITVLDQNTINQIAAGEVVERPASVVKELVENAIDAKATAITVEIRDGGISFIRVTDNGCGIAADEIELAFLRHSTSKIKSVEDLMSVSSLGFRGEALASIASVAQVELITKTANSLTGMRYVIEGGEKKSLEEIGAPDGTTFVVRNLFYNTPARRKFLKSANAEGSHISDLIEHISMSHPGISFRLIVNGKTNLHTVGNSNLREIIYNVYDREIEKNLVKIDSRNKFMHITGFIAKPCVSRGNKNFMNYYINGRYIKSNVINAALLDAYAPFLMQHRYPFTALHIYIDSKLIDINVHPTKMELRFSNNEDVRSFLYSAVSEALSEKILIPEVTVGNDTLRSQAKTPIASKQSAGIGAEPFEAKRRELDKRSVEKPKEEKAVKTVEDAKPDIALKSGEPIEKYEKIKATEVLKESTSPFLETEKQNITEVIRENIQENIQETKQEKIQAVRQETLFELEDSDIKEHDIKIIGQLFDTYWLTEYKDSLYIIDQHAAHEKVLYERFMKQFENHEILSQNILPPIVISLSMKEEDVLLKNMDIFTEIGYEIEHFGGKEYRVTAIPANLYGLNDREILTDILDNLVNENERMAKAAIKDRIATMSCKAAVKGNNKLSFEEAKALIGELLELDNPFNCPHGRPTIISMSKYEIEKKFRRIV